MPSFYAASLGIRIMLAEDRRVGKDQTQWHRLGFTEGQQGLLVTSLASGLGLLCPNPGFCT